MEDNRGSALIVAFGVGLAAGAITALLLAPATGEETRRRLHDLIDDLGERAKQGADTASKTVKEHADRLKVAVHEGQQAYVRQGQEEQS